MKRLFGLSRMQRLTGTPELPSSVQRVVEKATSTPPIMTHAEEAQLVEKIGEQLRGQRLSRHNVERLHQLLDVVDTKLWKLHDEVAELNTTITRLNERLSASAEREGNLQERLVQVAGLVERIARSTELLYASSDANVADRSRVANDARLLATLTLHYAGRDPQLVLGEERRNGRPFTQKSRQLVREMIARYEDVR